jgi:hypothetical protein
MTTPAPDTITALLIAALDMPPSEARERAIARAVECAKRHGYAMPAATCGDSASRDARAPRSIL